MNKIGEKKCCSPAFLVGFHFLSTSVTLLKFHLIIESNDSFMFHPYDVQGLVVPVIRNAEKMNFAEIEKEINTLAKKANDGTISIDEMAGGSFTISNGGVYGSLLSTPIINPPQVWHSTVIII
jgi:pyruvate/2-oxoglutarate dehydrogenase complex dihydrolipoamide acyltransferase (E2) component